MPVLARAKALLLILLLSVCWLAPAAQPLPLEDQYLAVVAIIQEGDFLASNAQPEKALARYSQAGSALQQLQRYNPTWNAKMVAYRLSYLNDKIAAVQQAQKGGAAVETGTKPGASDQSVVKTLQAGAEPRQQLRLRPAAGSKQGVTMTIQMGMTTKMGEMEIPKVTIPPMKMTMDLTVQSVSPEGDITYELSMGEAAVPDAPDANPQILEAMQKAMESLKGKSGTGKLNNRGVPVGNQINFAKDADPVARQSMEQVNDSIARMIMILPEEPIGPGGKWEIRSSTKAQGITIQQTVLNELVSVDGNVCNVKSTITQSATNQKFTNPSMPQLKLDMTKMTGNGSGESMLDLSKFIPLSGKATTTQEMNMSMSMGGQKQTVTMNLDFNLSFESK